MEKLRLLDSKINPLVFDLLQYADYHYDEKIDSYVKEYTDGDQIFTYQTFQKFPGDIRHYLLTGAVRNPKIFEWRDKK